MQILIVISTGLVLILFTFSIRLGLVWPERHRGCDAYYHLLCTEEFKKHRKIPIVLPPYYLLENQEQWYPPGFEIFLSLFPEHFLKKYHWAISPAVECFILAFLYTTIYIKTGNYWLAAMGSLLYAITPVAIGESSLNPRHLGALLIAVTMISLFEIIDTNNPYWLVPFFIFGFMLLVTHKMSSQLLYFLLIAMSLVFWNPIYIFGLISLAALTFLLSRGFFVKILRGHFDILSFWSRHWKNLGAHQIYSSPIYGNENRKDPVRFHQRNFPNFFRKIKMLGTNMFILLLIFPIIFYPELTMFDRQLFWWAVLTYCLAAATLFIPQFYFLGEGPKYLKMAALPVSYLSITPLLYGWNVDIYYFVLILFTAAVSLTTIIRGYRYEWEKTKKGHSEDKYLTVAINFLKNQKESVTACIPNHLSDMVAYFCRSRVLWGTHNYPFTKAEPFMPVWRKPLEYFIEEYNISHVLIDTSYVSPEALRLAPEKRAFTSDRYEIYETCHDEENSHEPRSSGDEEMAE